MRPILLASTLLAAAAISVTAHADLFQDFSMSLDGGPAITFTLDLSTPFSVISGLAVGYHPVTWSNGTTGNYVEFSDPDAAAAQRHQGQLDFSIFTDDLAYGDNYSGQQLYTGSESDPIFTPGTYDLVGDLSAGTPTDQTISLTIGPDPLVTSPVPEPSSMVLLGTGVLGCVGAVRRRFLKA